MTPPQKNAIMLWPLTVGFKRIFPPNGSEITKRRQVPTRMYAIIETGGKQYKVQNGDVIFVEKLAAAENDTVDFSVVAVNDGNGLKFGADNLKTAKVSGKVLKNGKAKKITVFTYKPKKNSKRKMGHRQPYSKVQIEKIEA